MLNEKLYGGGIWAIPDGYVPKSTASTSTGRVKDFVLQGQAVLNNKQTVSFFSF